MKRHALPYLVTLLALAGCLETDLTIRPDGSAAGTVGWIVSPASDEAAVRSALKADGVTVTRVEVKETTAAGAKADAPKVRRATAQVEAKSLAALTQTPLLKVLGVTATLGDPADGKRTLTVKAGNAKLPAPKPPTDSVVRLHLPGAVAQTSAKAEGSDVTWTVPASDYFGKPGVELTVAFAAAASPAPGD